MLRRLPAEVHRNLIFRHVGASEPMDLAELLASIGDDRLLLAKPFSRNTLIKSNPAIFPLLAALESGGGTGEKALVKRSLSDWAARALLESSALHVTAQLPSVAL